VTNLIPVVVARTADDILSPSLVLRTSSPIDLTSTSNTIDNMSSIPVVTEGFQVVDGYVVYGVLKGSRILGFRQCPHVVLGEADEIVAVSVPPCHL
jgi:hypothetical protein